jgi:hypothetical protein
MLATGIAPRAARKAQMLDHLLFTQHMHIKAHGGGDGLDIAKRTGGVRFAVQSLELKNELRCRDHVAVGKAAKRLILGGAL